MHVTWKLPGGGAIEADVDTGLTLMEAAVASDVPNIIGECGGCLSCATCHVYVDEGWRDKVGGPGETEEVMLDMVAGQRTAASRLSCQIEASDALDGLVLIVPEV